MTVILLVKLSTVSFHFINDASSIFHVSGFINVESTYVVINYDALLRG